MLCRDLAIILALVLKILAALEITDNDPIFSLCAKLLVFPKISGRIFTDPKIKTRRW